MRSLADSAGGSICSCAPLVSSVGMISCSSSCRTSACTWFAVYCVSEGVRFFSILICFCKEYFAFRTGLVSVVFTSPFFACTCEDSGSGDDIVSMPYDLTVGDFFVSHSCIFFPNMYLF